MLQSEENHTNVIEGAKCKIQILLSKTKNLPQTQHGTKLCSQSFMKFDVHGPQTSLP